VPRSDLDASVFPNATVHIDKREGVDTVIAPYQKVGKLARFEGEVEQPQACRNLRP